MSRILLIAAMLVAVAPVANTPAQAMEKVVTPEVWCDRNIPLPDETGLYSIRILGWQLDPGDYDIRIKRPDSSVDRVAAVTDDEGSLLGDGAVVYNVPEPRGTYQVQVYPWYGGTAPLASTEFHHNHFELVPGVER